MAIPQRGDRPGPGGPGNYKTNYRIRAKQVRVIVEASGEQLGVMLLNDAIRKAEELGLDLVEVSPLAVPPVCKIMDYGKFKYDAKKQAAESRRKQTVVEIKEVKFRPKTDEHDLDFKMKHIQRFLEDGNKVKVTIMFRGREITHAEIGRSMLTEVAGKMKTIGQVEMVPRIEGRNMFMIIAPLKKGQRPTAPAGAAPAGSGAPRPPSPPRSAGPRGGGPGPEIEVKKRPVTAGTNASAPDEKGST